MISKKLITTLSLAAMLATGLAGCNSQPEYTPTATQGLTSPPAATDSPGIATEPATETPATPQSPWADLLWIELDGIRYHIGDTAYQAISHFNWDVEDTLVSQPTSNNLGLVERTALFVSDNGSDDVHIITNAGIQFQMLNIGDTPMPVADTVIATMSNSQVNVDFHRGSPQFNVVGDHYMSVYFAGGISLSRSTSPEELQEVFGPARNVTTPTVPRTIGGRTPDVAVIFDFGAFQLAEGYITYFTMSAGLGRAGSPVETAANLAAFMYNNPRESHQRIAHLIRE